MSYTFTQLTDLWKRAGGNPLYAPMAAAVALAESGGNPNATHTNSNGTVDRGLWQINSIHGSLSVTDPVKNARAAISISSNGTNWRPWCTAWSTGRCSGTFLGKGSPVLAHLPIGASTGNTPTGTASGMPDVPAVKAIQAAMGEVGKAYQFGASDASGLASPTFDCSSLVQTAYKAAGITLPRTAAEQQSATARITQAELRPGDLVFYGDPATHVMLYIGGGYVIEAPHTGANVEVTKAWSGATNFGRVTGSGAQGLVDGIVSTVGGLLAPGVSQAVSGLTSALDPTTWFTAAWNEALVPLGYVLEMVAGAALIVISLIVVILSTKEGRKGAKWAAVGTAGAVTGGAAAAGAEGAEAGAVAEGGEAGGMAGTAQGARSTSQEVEPQASRSLRTETRGRRRANRAGKPDSGGVEVVSDTGWK